MKTSVTFYRCYPIVLLVTCLTLTGCSPKNDSIEIGALSFEKRVDNKFQFEFSTRYVTGDVVEFSSEHNGSGTGEVKLIYLEPDGTVYYGIMLDDNTIQPGVYPKDIQTLISGPSGDPMTPANLPETNKTLTAKTKYLLNDEIAYKSAEFGAGAGRIVELVIDENGQTDYSILTNDDELQPGITAGDILELANREN